MPRTESWKYVCFTSFNPIDSQPVKGDKVSYLVFQREAGNDTNREHWQGYAEATQGLTVKQWQSQLECPKCHVERRKGTQSQAIEYCKKDDTRLLGPFEVGEPEQERGKKRRNEITVVYKDAADKATSARDYLRIVGEGDPAGVAKSFNSIKSYAEFLFPQEEFPVYTPPEWCNKAWSLPLELNEWVTKELGKKDRPKCLVLVGPSRLGKTAWARSLGRHMYWRGCTNITKWDAQAQHLVFDDIEWNFIPQKKSMLTCMGAATVTDKYKGKKDIIVDKPAIVLLNEFDIDSIAESEYWKKNLTVVFVTEPLFQSQQLALSF